MNKSNNIIEEIKKSWGWTGIEPKEVIDENNFGNLIIKDTQNKYWRVCPEDIYCTVIAKNKKELDALYSNQEFLEDWHMNTLVRQAKQSLGELDKGKKYYLVIPSVLGGDYGISNIKTAPLTEIIGLSGHIGNQIKDLPDGTKIKLEVTD